MIPKKLIYPIKLSHIQKYELSEGAGAGGGHPLRFWYSNLKGGADYTHHITTIPLPPGFSDLPTALPCI